MEIGRHNNKRWKIPEAAERIKTFCIQFRVTSPLSEIYRTKLGIVPVVQDLFPWANPVSLLLATLDN